jgi:fido (protein-threonine AMPylation protein)
MANHFQRPRDQQEIREREAAGLWRAQALATKIAEREEKITLETILGIHYEFFRDACPEHAGRFRGDGDDVQPLECIEPPLGKVVAERMYEFWRALDYRLASIPKKPIGASKSSRQKWNTQVIECAAWTHHQISAIHPFCEGNGRMARIINNLILRKFGLFPSDIQHLGDDKPRYLSALCQIDKASDYGPLMHIIVEGMRATYEKIYTIARKNNPKPRAPKRRR